VARAAFNLGQLYEAGDGVPRNPDLARAWFKASGLPAAQARMASLPKAPPTATALSAPILVAPRADEAASAPDQIELVWVSPAQPEAVRFFVELRSLESGPLQDVFSGFVDTSSQVVPLLGARGPLAWRVMAVARASGHYAASPWSTITIRSGVAR
jgi:hypothetical protein